MRHPSRAVGAHCSVLGGPTLSVEQRGNSPQSSRHGISHQYKRITMTKAAGAADAQNRGKAEEEEEEEEVMIGKKMAVC